MPRFLASSLLGIAIGACAAPAPPPEPGFALTETRRAELLQAREAVWRAWFAGDTVQLRQLLPDNLVAIPPQGDGWQGLREVMAESRGFAATGGTLVRLEFPRTEIQSFGTTAVIFSSYRFETATNGQSSTLRGRVTEVFEFRDGRWVNASWHMDNDP